MVLLPNLQAYLLRQLSPGGDPWRFFSNFKGVPAEVIRKAEDKQFVSDICPPIVLLLTMPVLDIVTRPWYLYFDLVRFVNLLSSRKFFRPSRNW